MSLPPISVLIPTKDMNHHIPPLMHNISGQINPKLGDEVIILFDGTPIDNQTHAFLKRFPYVKPLVTQQNKGVSVARNILIEHAKNTLLRFQDNDDWLAPYSLENARKIIAQLKDWHVLVGGQFMFRDHQFLRMTNLASLKQSVEALTRHNTLVVNMCYVNKQSAIAAGGFDPKLAFEEDWDFWLRMLRRFGGKAFITTPHIFGIYNSYMQEMQKKGQERSMTVDGMPVRDYIRKKNGLPPPASNTEQA